MPLSIRDSGSCYLASNLTARTGQAAISASGNGNLVIRNTAAGNSVAQFAFDGFNDAPGPVIDVFADDDISGTPGADHPWANFVF